jgi:hypothetical protein
MSQYIEFFAAPDDRAATAVHARGPKSSFTTVSGTFFDADDAVLSWESLMTGRARNDLVASGEPRMVAPWVNDGSAVFALSDQLIAHLVRAEPTQLREIAKAWLAELQHDGDDLDGDAALSILGGVADLARDATRAGRTMYCWVSG